MLTIVVFGASGDLAQRKTYPALFSLWQHDLLPQPFQIIGYARSNLDQTSLQQHLRPALEKKQAPAEDLERFLAHCSYVSGQYEGPEGYQQLASMMGDHEDRIFYLALPPSVFLAVGLGIHHHLLTKGSRVIVEKPFGRDSESSAMLASQLGSLFTEPQLYRIDHYLGKEMVKALLVLRFGNQFLHSLWNREHIASIQIIFKETLGVEGRGGYFDSYGIIRDVMQNHLLQMLSVVAMDRPVSLEAEAIRDAKVRVLKAVKPLQLDQVILGQYTGSAAGVGYREDPTVPADSLTPTFCLATLHIDNDRWDGVPFILRSGKALDRQKAEIRVQFRPVPGCLFAEAAIPNELVIRVQPNEAIYLKMVTKRPGLSNDPIVTDMDLSYANRYADLDIPEAYESLLLDVIRGDQSSFVRADELALAWDIFTPLLHQIERDRIVPLPYPRGSRGPPESDALLSKLGYRPPHVEYGWPLQKLSKGLRSLE